VGVNVRIYNMIYLKNASRYMIMFIYVGYV